MKLLAELKQSYPDAHIVLEENFVDITMRTHNELFLFEIKSDLAPRSVLRQAIGQLLEYAFYARPCDTRSIALVAVGRSPLSVLDRQYLEQLRENFSLPLEYRVVST